MSMDRVLTSLRNVPSAPTSPEEIQRLRADAWRQQGVVCVHVDEIADDWLKARLEQFATKVFGKRGKR